MVPAGRKTEFVIGTLEGRGINHPQRIGRGTGNGLIQRRIELGFPVLHDHQTAQSP